MKASAKEIQALVPVGVMGKIRRALGIFTPDEKEVLRYARKLDTMAKGIVSRTVILTACPDWMRKEDYKSLLNLQKKVNKRRIAK